MTSTLALDLGKTSCRAALFADADRRDTVKVPGSIGLAERAGVEAAVESITTAAGGLGADRVDRVALGVAGLGRTIAAPATKRQARTLATAVIEALDSAEMLVCSDIVCAHAGALAGASGVVLVAGTGAVSLGVDDVGRSAICDGWGYLLGDEGSGYAIGRAGLAAALRSHDGRGSPTQLHDRAVDQFGDLDRLPTVVHAAENRARAVASFAPEVLRAVRDGDSEATRIRDGATRDLARTTRAAVGLFETGSIDHAVVGGLAEAGDAILAAYDAALADASEPADAAALRRRPPAGDALDGAFLLADQPTIPHGSLAVRVGAVQPR